MVPLSIANLHHFTWVCLEANTSPLSTSKDPQTEKTEATKNFDIALKMAEKIPFENGVYLYVVLTRGIHIHQMNEKSLKKEIINMGKRAIEDAEAPEMRLILSPLAKGALEDLKTAVLAW